MSIFRTLKQRGHDPSRTVVDAMNQYIITADPTLKSQRKAAPS